MASLVWPLPGGTLDLAPMFFLVTAAIWLWVERYGRPTRLVPIAARQVLSALGDAVMVLDPLGRVLDLNPAALRELARTGPVPPGTLIGRPWDDLVGAPLSAVMMDIDHFKQVNDTYGHAAGDEVLVKVAHQLTLGLRAGDVVARYGGEEFVLLLPGATADVAARRAQEMRDRCARVAVRAAHVTVRITISAGVAQLPAGGTSESFLQTADGALYEAKAAGRDVVVVAPVAVGKPVS